MDLPTAIAAVDSPPSMAFPSAWVDTLLRDLGASSVASWYRPDVTDERMWWSPALYAMLGYTPEELPPSAANYVMLVAPAERKDLAARMATMDATRKNLTYDAEFRMLSRDGSLHWCRCMLSAIHDPCTGRTAVFALIRRFDPDSTIVRSELNLIQGTLNIVLDSIGYPVVLTTAGGRIIQANKATAAVTGRSGAALPGMMLCEVFPDAMEAPAFNARICAVAAAGAPQQCRIRARGRSWQVNFAPLREEGGGITRVVVLAEDITTLQDEHEQVLQRERALTDTLVREVNHRIKNHLQALVGLLRRASWRDGSAAETIDLAVAQTMTIATVHGLLSERGPKQLTLGVLTGGLVALLQGETSIPIDSSYDAGVESQYLANALSVPVALTLSELVTNAIKHTRAEPNARVSVRLYRDGNDTVVEITNTPATLALDAERARGDGGLSLARALLARAPAAISLSQQGEAVVARLTLEGDACLKSA